jgi:hypothetical protein
MMITEGNLALNHLRRAQKLALLVGILGLVACFLRFDARQAFQSYLLGYVFWILLPLGSLAILMLHHLVGGGWGFVIRRLLEAATRTFPVMAVLFVPLLFGIGELYPWADLDQVASDPHLEHKTPYLNQGFFVTRAVLYFVIWGALTLALNRWSARQDNTDDPALVRRLQGLSGVGLVLFGLTTTFASIDWVMSLEPLWFSTIFGAIFIVGGTLSALLVMILTLAALHRQAPLDKVVTPTHFHDLGKLLLTFVMLWAYIAFSQYLIIWSGNTAEEAAWYVKRQEGGWQHVALILIVFHFAVPFILLLSRQRKRQARSLARLAWGLLLLRFVDVFWLVCPAFRPSVFVLDWLDIVAPVGIGGIWTAFFLRELNKRPLLPLKDPRFEPMLADAGVTQHG